MLTTGSTNFLNGMIGIANSNVQLGNVMKAGDNLNAIAQYKTDRPVAETKQALQQFEGLFVGQLLRLMFDTVEVNELFGGGMAEETYRGMLVDEYGMNIAKSGGIGITDKLQKSLHDFQNINNESASTMRTVDSAVNAYTKLYNF